MKVYIAGGFYGDYKQIITDALADSFELFDPEGAPQAHHIPGVYVGRDLAAIRDCELLLAVQTDYPYLYGMCAEVGYATALNIPVIYVCLTSRVDSFLSGLARSTFTDLATACGFIVLRGGKL